MVQYSSYVHLNLCSPLTHNELVVHTYAPSHSHVADSRQGCHDEEQDGTPLCNRAIAHTGFLDLPCHDLAGFKLLSNLHGLGLGSLQGADEVLVVKDIACTGGTR